MMVRPLKAAKPATTSAMLARSQVTVMRGSSARVSMAALRMPMSGARAAWRAGARTAAGAGAASAESSSVAATSATATSATVALASADDQAWKPWADPKLTRMASVPRSTL